MDQSRCKYWIRSISSLTNITQQLGVAFGGGAGVGALAALTETQSTRLRGRAERCGPGKSVSRIDE